MSDDRVETNPLLPGTRIALASGLRRLNGFGIAEQNLLLDAAKALEAHDAIGPTPAQRTAVARASDLLDVLYNAKHTAPLRASEKIHVGIARDDLRRAFAPFPPDADTATQVRSSTVEPTAHNGPVEGSTPSAPTNWPFAESPVDFAKRLWKIFMANGMHGNHPPLMPTQFLAAVNHVLIEKPPAFAPWVLESQKPHETKAEKTILTENIRPPIPVRTFDWSACRDGYEPGDPIGYGETEAKAIDALKWAEEERL